MDTGEFLKTEEGRIPAELYEQVMTGYFPVSAEQVRKKCGYEVSVSSRHVSESGFTRQH